MRYFVLTISFILFLAACDSNKVMTIDAPKSQAEQDFKALIDSHAGKTIYVDFWASWCVPCRKSFPWLNSLSSKYDTNKFVVLSVNLDNQKKLAEKFLSQTPADFKIFYDPDSRVARQYKVEGMPASYLISPNGDIIWRHRGFNENNANSYESEIEKALSSE